MAAPQIHCLRPWVLFPNTKTAKISRMRFTFVISTVWPANFLVQLQLSERACSVFGAAGRAIWVSAHHRCSNSSASSCVNTGSDINTSIISMTALWTARAQQKEKPPVFSDMLNRFYSSHSFLIVQNPPSRVWQLQAIMLENMTWAAT